MARTICLRRLFADSVRRYKDLGALGQPANRLQQLLPYIQFNENGEVIILPGEIFCRYRDDNNNLCQFRWQYKCDGGIRHHYNTCHHLPAEKRHLHHWRKHFLVQVTRWYDEVVRGDLPQWLPRDAIDTPVLNISFPLPLNDEANEESNQNGNNLSSADRPSGMCCEEDWRY